MLTNVTNADTAVLSKERADYDATKQTRFTCKRMGLAPGSGSFQFHFRNEMDYYKIIEMTRDMDRNDSMVGQAIDLTVANIVQDGFKLNPATSDAKRDEDIKARWLEESTGPDVMDVVGELTLQEQETAVARAVLLDGDSIVTGTADGPLQIFESHEIGTLRRHHHIAEILDTVRQCEIKLHLPTKKGTDQM